MQPVKAFAISKRAVWEAWKQVKQNGGAGGVDRQSIEDFEKDLGKNLYKVWNRMSSGSYLPPPVRKVAIPKKKGGVRILGVPTVADRVAQMAVKRQLEPILDPVFHEDSYGYRPNKSAHQAIEQTKRRCWKYLWVVEFDIRSFFDNLDHVLLMRALRKHCSEKWVLLYVERWLKAPLEDTTGKQTPRLRGTPQGGVISPLLANLFLHYAFDKWVGRALKDVPFCRYADDGLLHCASKAQAQMVLGRLTERLREVGLEIHPEKSGIVYCKKDYREESHDKVSFDFLGYTFRPRLARKHNGEKFVSFLPGISQSSARTLRQTIRGWKLQFEHTKSIQDLSRMLNAIIRGWWNYYCAFTKSATKSIWWRINQALMRWAMRKYKRFRIHKRKASQWLGRIAKDRPFLFAHWENGFKPKAA